MLVLLRQLVLRPLPLLSAPSLLPLLLEEARVEACLACALLRLLYRLALLRPPQLQWLHLLLEILFLQVQLASRMVHLQLLNLEAQAQVRAQRRQQRLRLQEGRQQREAQDAAAPA